MASLEDLSQRGALAAERCVRDSIEMDYAFQLGKLDEWIERKYAELLGAHDVNSYSGVGITPGVIPGTDPQP